MLTKAEEEWIKKMQKVLDECPTDRMTFYTIGDRDLVIFNVYKINEIEKWLDCTGHEFGTCVDRAHARMGKLKFPHLIRSTAGN